MAAARKPSVLILFDDDYLAGLFGRKFEREGFTVRVANSIADARKKIAKSSPGAILIDVAAEDCKGFEFLEEIRMSPTTFAIPKIVVTELGDVASIRRALKIGADDYLIHGHFIPAEAVRKVRKFLL